jgi:DNA invertase Pin-like site-specific DNA recombinase
VGFFIWKKYNNEEEKNSFKPIPLKKPSSDKIKIKITCLLTKKTTIIDSINQCAKNLNISNATVNRGLKEKKYKNIWWEKI